MCPVRKAGEIIMVKRDGSYPSILIEAETLSEGFQKAVIACRDKGYETETPKYRKGKGRGYDADINVRVKNSQWEFDNNLVHKYGVVDDDRGLMQYILEVTHGIHNHWKKDPNDPTDTAWGYTYNERFAPQIPFVLARIKQDWENKQNLTSRKYQFIIWRPREDSILEQEDPPCWQRGHLRFLQDEKGEWYLNYITDWRSRDLIKAWLENNLGQARLHRLFADKISDMLGIPIHLGNYIDRSSSLHIYAEYVHGEGLDTLIDRMRESAPEDMCLPLFLDEPAELKSFVGAQLEAEKDGRGKNLPKNTLNELGHDVKNFAYPDDWDTWPKDWDQEAKLENLI